jgi:hypothetical protein
MKKKKIEIFEHYQEGRITRFSLEIDGVMLAWYIVLTKLKGRSAEERRAEVM